MDRSKPINGRNAALGYDQKRWSFTAHAGNFAGPKIYDEQSRALLGFTDFW